jgi:GNAT superfamily N-acetyltransferase
MIHIAQTTTKPVKVFYLKMETRPVFDFEKWKGLKYSFLEVPKPISTSNYLEMYQSVGLRFNWFDRLLIPINELETLINKPNTFVYEFRIENKFAGWAEFVDEQNFVELQYFGLTEPFTGKGFGKFFLSVCIEKAWSFNRNIIQVNTCELDHENALNVYKSLGFVEYKTQIENRKVLK